MKAKMILICIFTLLVILISSTAFCSEDITVYVNGNQLWFDAPPVMENGRVLVPVGAIFEALGCYINFDTHDGKDFIYAYRANDMMYTELGSDSLFVNGEELKLDVGSKTIDNRTLVPIRAVSEGLNAHVEWEEHTKSVIINTKRGLHSIKNTNYNYLYLADDGKKLIKIDYSYPEIYNPNGDEYIDNINRYYKERAESYFENSKEVYEDEASLIYKENPNSVSLPMTFSLTYDVHTDRNDILSITEINNYFLGGAHPNSERTSKTYDLKNKKELALTDILNGTEEEVYELAFNAFDNYFEQNKEYFNDASINEIKASMKEEIKNVRFYLTDNSIVFYFQPYQVAAYALGYPTTQILYEGNENLFKIHLYDALLDEFTVMLESTDDTGYIWQRIKQNSDIIEVSSDYIANADNPYSVATYGGIYTFSVKGVKCGRCSLSFAYLDEEQGEESAIKYAVYELYVSKDNKITVLSSSVYDKQ